MKRPPAHTCQENPNIPCAACKAVATDYAEWSARQKEAEEKAAVLPLNELERATLQDLRNRRQDLDLLDHILLKSLAKREHL